DAGDRDGQTEPEAETEANRVPAPHRGQCRGVDPNGRRVRTERKATTGKAPVRGGTITRAVTDRPGDPRSAGCRPAPRLPLARVAPSAPRGSQVRGVCPAPPTTPAPSPTTGRAAPRRMLRIATSG